LQLKPQHVRLVKQVQTLANTLVTMPASGSATHTEKKDFKIELAFLHPVQTMALMCLAMLRWGPLRTWPNWTYCSRFASFSPALGFSRVAGFLPMIQTALSTSSSSVGGRGLKVPLACASCAAAALALTASPGSSVTVASCSRWRLA
jgi:hypothetical protein